MPDSYDFVRVQANHETAAMTRMTRPRRQAKETNHDWRGDSEIEKTWIHMFSGGVSRQDNSKDGGVHLPQVSGVS
jgi:hypothetical protein